MTNQLDTLLAAYRDAVLRSKEFRFIGDKYEIAESAALEAVKNYVRQLTGVTNE